MILLLAKIAVFSGLFSALLFATLFSFGQLRQRLFRPVSSLSASIQTLLNLLLGLLLAALLYSCCYLLALSGLVLQLLLSVFACCDISFQTSVAVCLESFRSSLRVFFYNIVFQLLLSTAAIASAGTYITPAALMQFTGLPIDFFIPYNGARFFLEAIPFASECSSNLGIYRPRTTQFFAAGIFLFASRYY